MRDSATAGAKISATDKIFSDFFCKRCHFIEKLVDFRCIINLFFLFFIRKFDCVNIRFSLRFYVDIITYTG